MNLTHLRYFVAVVETGGFTRAAERANVTQPTLSAGIQRLEQWLGADLFERGRRVTLTAAGRRFLARARTILEESRAARAELREKPEPLRLRLGLLRTLFTGDCARLLTELRRAQPSLELELSEGSAPMLAARLRGGQLDVALTALEVARDRQATLPLYREGYVIAVPAGHSLARRVRCRLAELDGQPFIIRGECEMQPAAQRLFTSHGVRPRIVQRGGGDDRALALVAAGMGLALVPESFRAEGVAHLAVPEIDFNRRIGLAWGAGSGEALDRFRDFARGHDWTRLGRRRPPAGPDIAH